MPLYSQAKKPRFQTSAKPSPPPPLVTPFSKAYDSPVGSASLGVGSPSIRHRSMKCSCEAAFSVLALAFHLAANALGVMVGWVDTTPLPRGRPGRSTSRASVSGLGMS